MLMCNMCAYAPTIGDSFVWLQLISSYHGVSTAKCRVRATDRGHLMMSDDFGSKTNDEKARQEAATILWRSRRCLRASLAGTYCERPALQRSTCWNSSDVAVVTVMPVIARWESPLSPAASLVPRLPYPRACTRVLVRSRCSFWVRQSWCCCLVRSGSYGKRPSSSV